MDERLETVGGRFGDDRRHGAKRRGVFTRHAHVDPEGEAIYVADRENHCIRKITLSNGYVSTFAGTPRTSGYQNGPAGTALFNKPIGLTVNSEGDLYVGDSDNYAVRRIAIE